MTSFPSFLPFFLLLPPFQESIHEAYDFVSIKPSISLSLCLPPFLPLFLFYRKKLTRARARGKSWKVMRVVLELAAMYNRRPKRDAKDRDSRDGDRSLSRIGRFEAEACVWHRVASTDLLALNGTPTASVPRSWAAISPLRHAPCSPHREPLAANRGQRR